MASPTNKRILIIEDEPDIVRGLKDALEFEGYRVLSSGKGAEGVQLARSDAPDCIVLDLMLPDGNGYDFCQQLRHQNALVPILMLTARSQESDKIRGLESGADDYVTKPFSVGELLARIRALFRRMSRLSEEAASERFRVGKVEVDAKTHTLLRRGQSLSLSFYEVELLKLLHERANQPVSRDEILDKIWGVDCNPTNRTVDNFIVKLRKKVEERPDKPKHILTVYGFGYKLVP
ncbi:MAG: response regulator transcription factor [Deltaproteobacteria bacterium]|nr:response regulator transcription factor [Deltaproteobacteria bacterium]